MNKTELINAAAKKSGLTIKETEAALGAILEVMEDALVAGDKIQVTGFGVFHVTERAARDGRNPRTGEKLHVEASRNASFAPSSVLKKKLNNKD
ncbi:MAG: HU family DNA-binding protein [Clostridia bacterium]|nr:HU family DNA-binding protein [Clostridia bacterium]